MAPADAARVLLLGVLGIADLFNVPCPSAGALGSFEAARRPYWVTGEFSVTLDAVQQAMTDRWLPERARRTRQRRRLIEQADALVRRNTENLRWATLQNINEAFRRFGVQLDQDLAEAIRATQGAIRAADAQRRDSSHSLTADIARLNRALEELSQARRAVVSLACNPPETGAADVVMAAGAAGVA